jgi:heme-degrading monooxygenase HmoA
MVAALATMATSATGIADISRMASESIEGWLRDYDGYRGLIVLTDEDGRRAQVMTLWETPEAEVAARESRTAMRDRIAELTGAEVVDFAVYEVAVFETGG